MKDILGEITYLREKRGWTEYQLAESSGLPQSTISSWYRKKVLPSVPSLDKICSAFGISLSQLFSEDDDYDEDDYDDDWVDTLETNVLKEWDKRN